MVFEDENPHLTARMAILTIDRHPLDYPDRILVSTSSSSSSSSSRVDDDGQQQPQT